MTIRPAFSVRNAHWGMDGPALRAVREAVFVREQGVPVELEWDEYDATSLHVLAEADGDPIGTGRLLPDHQIGRMAVLPGWRGCGVGSAILAALVELAMARGSRVVCLNAQTRAQGFYLRHGFIAEGKEFPDAGIPHIRMRRELHVPNH